MYRGLCFESGPGKPDICMPRETDFVFVSEKVALVVRELCDNVTLTACEEVLTRGDMFAVFVSQIGCSTDAPRTAQQTAARDRVKKRGA
jgi:hypothetical protein